MNEEAGFIAAMLADPDDRTVLLVYADWLDERNDPRGEYLRLLASYLPNPVRLAELNVILDTGWLQLIGSRGHKAGSCTRYKAPADTDNVLELRTITAERPGATVRLTVRRRPRTSQFGWWELEVTTRS